MVVDFATIKRAYQEYVEPRVEHQNLNETLNLPEYTTEHVAMWIWQQLHPVLPQLYKVRLWEGKSSFAEVCNGDQIA
jgi:6-pyruvoyltetrahydropterin/6-carboxytetrahydropterin synthase